MREAEKTLRRRRQQTANAAASEEALSVSRAEERRNDLACRVEELVPEALTGLRAAGYPGGRLFRVYRGQLRPRKELAGWPAGGFSFKNKDQVGPDRINPIYLLSDGTWLYHTTEKPTSFRGILAQFEGGTLSPGSLLRSELPSGVLEELKRLAGHTRT